MAQIPVQPTYLKDVVLTIGTAGEFEKHVSGVTFTPTVGTATWKGLDSAAVFTQASNASWVVQLDYVQDWDTTGSLSAYLFNNAGSEVEITFTPQTGSGSWEATCILVPGAVGGAVDTFATSSVQLPVQGQPVYVPAV